MRARRRESATGRAPVLWAVDYFGHGGIARYAVDLANLLGGTTETVVASTDRGPVEGCRGRSVVWFPRGADTALDKLRAAGLGLVRARCSVAPGDVAWIPLGVRPLYELLLLLALRSAGATVVATVHNRSPHSSEGDSPVVTAAARLADRVVVHTGALRQWAEERGMRAAALPFLVPDLAAGSGAAAARAGLGVPAGHVLVVFLGYLVAYKGPDVLLRALARAQADEPGLPVHVLMAGQPAEGLDLPGLVGELGLEGAVTLRPGWLEESTMSDLFDAADAVALTHRRIDNSGVAAVARLRGLPAVASDLPLLRETYSGAALFAAPGDPEALARCLRELPGRLPELAAAAARHPEDDTLGAYVGFVEELTDRARSAEG